MKDYARKTLVIVWRKKDAIFGAHALEDSDAVDHRDYVEGPQYVWFWIDSIKLQLCEPEKYNRRFKKWSPLDLPIIPERLRYSRPDSPRFKVLKKLIKGKNITYVVVAVCADLHQEYLAAKILNLAGWKRQARLFRSPWPFTEGHLREGIIRSRRRGGLGDSMDVETKMDWLFLINSVRALTMISEKRVYLSRKSAPALSLLLARDRLASSAQGTCRVQVEAAPASGGDTIRGFVLERTPEGNNQILAPVRAQMTSELLAQGRGILLDLDEELDFLSSRLPFSLSTLLAEIEERSVCNDQHALEALLDLYTRGLITYPKTESEKLPGDLSETQLNETIRSVAGYIDINVDLRKCMVSRETNAGLFGLEGEGIAPAIIPTGRQPRELEPREREIYDLIAKRFVAAFYEPAEILRQHAVIDFWGTTVEIENRVPLENSGRWTGFYRPADLMLSERRFRRGEEFEVKNVSIVPSVQKYSRRELIREMGKSFGTNTYHASRIIEKFSKRHQITSEGDRIKLSPYGKEVAEMIDGDEIADPAYTAQWADRLRQIERGEADPSQVLHGYEACMRSFVERTRTWVKGRNIGKCPLCGAQVILNRQEKIFRCRHPKKKPCLFKIPRNILQKYGRKLLLTLAEGRRLMTHEPVAIYGCKTRSGKAYGMILRVPLPQPGQEYKSLEFLGKA